MVFFRLLILTLTTLYIGAATAGAFGFGDRGASVREVQQRLADAGYGISADGAYGRATEAAVKEFQLSHDLAADGVVGPATYHALMGKEFPASPQIETGKRDVSEISLEKAREVIDEAEKYIGVPYRFGGSDADGFDCAGFVRYVFRRTGIELPRSADEQYAIGRRVAISALRPGDLVFFSTYEEGVSHSGIYVGGGRFISATTSSGIAEADMTSGYWYDCYIGAKRIL